MQNDLTGLLNTTLVHKLELIALAYELELPTTDLTELLSLADKLDLCRLSWRVTSPCTWTRIDANWLDRISSLHNKNNIFRQWNSRMDDKNPAKRNQQKIHRWWRTIDWNSTKWKWRQLKIKVYNHNTIVQSHNQQSEQVVTSFQWNLHIVVVFKAWQAPIFVF